MKHEAFDVAVIGGGPAGIAAAASASKSGARVILVEREGELGGILKQCIHDGFGLFRYGERLTGPEYAFLELERLKNYQVIVKLGTFLTSLENEAGSFRLTFVSSEGILEVEAGAVVTATGCRERSGRQILLQGERPSGIFTAGQAQGLVNLKGYMPGRKILILGSGDIGLIMARRLTLEGGEVLGVCEVKPEPSGLTRNIAQCLEDFSIPLHLSRTVKRIHGRRRVEGVTTCRVDEAFREIPGTEEYAACDTLVLSVGLIPENEILDSLSPRKDAGTAGPEVDQEQMTSIPGLFTCGNAQHVNDLVDYVSESGETAGKAAAQWATGRSPMGRSSGTEGAGIPVHREGELLYQVPGRINPAGGDLLFSFRAAKTMEKGRLSLKNPRGQEILAKEYRYLKPPEMEQLAVSASLLQEGAWEGAGGVPGKGLGELNNRSSLGSH